MTTTPNLLIEHIVQSQAQKEVTANESADALDEAGQDTVDLDTSAIGSPPDLTVSGGDYRGNFLLRLINTAPGAFNLIVPDGKRFFAVQNVSGQTASVDVTSPSSSPLAPISITNGTTKLIYSSGTVLLALT